METYNDAPQELRNFLSYHETVRVSLAGPFQNTIWTFGCFCDLSG